MAPNVKTLGYCKAWACAACYGQSDSPMARGMNWGIFTLLGVIGLVLGGVAGFFVYLAKRAASTPAGARLPQPQSAGNAEGLGNPGAPDPALALRLGQPRSGPWMEATSKI